jgi:hypothetical protein
MPAATSKSAQLPSCCGAAAASSRELLPARRLHQLLRLLTARMCGPA